MEEDVTDICRDIFQCIREMKWNYGAGTVAGVLHGSKAVRIKSGGLDQISVYGRQSSVTEFRLKEIIRELAGMGLLEESDDQYTVLRLGEGAEEVLDGNRQIIMKFPRPKDKKMPLPKKRAGVAGDLDSASWQLFERLRTLRLTIARETGVPPYIVFTDKTLIDMCVKRPKNKSEMLDVSGVGEAKYKRYGERFLEEIREE